MKNHGDSKMICPIVDGMSEEEGSFLAVAEPNSNGIDESVEVVEENCDGINPFNLKKFSIHLKKLTIIENAVKIGCQSVLLTNVKH